MKTTRWCEKKRAGPSHQEEGETGQFVKIVRARILKEMEDQTVNVPLACTGILALARLKP